MYVLDACEKSDSDMLKTLLIPSNDQTGGVNAQIVSGKFSKTVPWFLLQYWKRGSECANMQKSQVVKA